MIQFFAKVKFLKRVSFVIRIFELTLLKPFAETVTL